MGSLLQYAKWWAWVRLVSARRQVTMMRSPWVMGRIACLGSDVHRLIDARLPLVNTQKGRIDTLLGYRFNPQLRPNTARAASHFLRKDVIPFIAQQEAFAWPSANPPVALFMDSFSELTDQLFTERQMRRSLCANYSDVEHSEAFNRYYECPGLLNLEDIEEYYRDFYAAIRADFGRIPIIYLHFPIDLEKREKFRARHSAIVKAINAMTTEFAPFYSIEVDPGLPRWPDTRAPGNLEAFPYHYHSSTYANLAAKVRALNIPL